MNTNPTPTDPRVFVNYVERELQPLRERIAALEAQLAQLQPEQPKRTLWAALGKREATQ